MVSQSCKYDPVHSAKGFKKLKYTLMIKLIEDKKMNKLLKNMIFFNKMEKQQQQINP